MGKGKHDYEPLLKGFTITITPEIELKNPSGKIIKTLKLTVVPFGVYDSESTRLGQKSEADLKQILKKTLEGTNWRLMSEGVSYRLGLLSGRLRGYEREEDLVKLIKS